MIAIIFMGMLFYPVVMQEGLIKDMQQLFEAPVMNSLLAAFGADLNSMSNVLGYYVTYNSIYLALLASIYSILLTSKIISKEENEKTAEFLLTRPVTRSEVFISKFLVFLTNVLILNIVMITAGFISLEMFKYNSPLQLNITQKTKTILIETFEKNPQKYTEYFNIDEDMYYNYLIKEIQKSFTYYKEDIKTSDIDMKTVENLLNDFSGSPKDFIDKLRKEPEKYMNMFNIPEEDKQMFMEGLKRTEQQLNKMLEEFEKSYDVKLQIFRDYPKLVLSKLRDNPDLFPQFKSMFNISSLQFNDILIHYKVRNFFILSLYNFLLAITMGCIGLFISVLMKRGRQVLGISIGITIAAFFIDSITRVASDTEALGYISPFKFVNINVTNPAYGLDWWRIAYFVALSLVLVISALIIYRKKDILV